MKQVFAITLFMLLASTDLFGQQAAVNFAKDDCIIFWFCGGLGRNPGIPHCYFYRLGSTGLSRDTSHIGDCFRPDNLSQLNFNDPMSAGAYSKLKGMRNSISPEMLEQAERSFGRQAIDGGMIFVWASINNVEYKWHFTGALNEFAPETRKFADYLYHGF